MGYCRLVARREYRALQLANVRLLLGDVRLELRLLVVVVVQSRVERPRAAKGGLYARRRMRNIRREYQRTSADEMGHGAYLTTDRRTAKPLSSRSRYRLGGYQDALPCVPMKTLQTP